MTYFVDIFQRNLTAQLAGAIKYTDCISAVRPPLTMRVLDIT